MGIHSFQRRPIVVMLGCGLAGLALLVVGALPLLGVGYRTWRALAGALLVLPPWGLTVYFAWLLGTAHLHNPVPSVVQAYAMYGLVTLGIPFYLVALTGLFGGRALRSARQVRR